MPRCCLAAGLAPVATRQLRLTFVLVFLPLCASHLAVRCVSCAKRSEQRDRERNRKILKYATKARWNFKLSRGLLIRPSGARGGKRGINFFRPRSCGLSNAAQCGARSCKQELPSCMQISWRYTHSPCHCTQLCCTVLAAKIIVWLGRARDFCSSCRRRRCFFCCCLWSNLDCVACTCSMQRTHNYTFICAV